MKKFYGILLIMLVSFHGRAQNIGAGAEVLYNWQTQSLGAGVRANIFPDNSLSFEPQFSYYFPFNKIEEYFFGLGLSYKVLRISKFNFYVLGYGAYNSWLNYDQSPMENAKQNNWAFEAGGGVSTNTCIRPFLEHRYNIRFQEAITHLGVLYIFGCGGKRRSPGSRGECPVVP